MGSMSATIEKIREEAAAFENRDLLLCFSQKKQFQSPLLLGNADTFFETWQNEAKPRELASFFQISSHYDEAHQKSDLEKFRKVLKSKSEDFCNQDLYMVTGFIKWGEKSLAPALLIPLHYDSEHDSVSFSMRDPIENIALSTLDKSIRFPVAADFTKDGNFAIKKFFDALEKKIAHKTEWKFTRNGYCITFYSTNRLLLKKNLASENWNSAKVANNEFFSATIGNNGFIPQPSLFEEAAFDHVYNPADHYFPYVLDSQTTKAAIDALNEDVTSFAVQTLPGSDKFKLAVNIVADLIQQKKKVGVISRRAITKQNFDNAWKPPFRTFQALNRDELKQELIESREKLVTYYDTVNAPISPSGIKLSELFEEIAQLKPVKSKFSNDLFKNIEQVRYTKFKSMRNSIEQLANLFLNENGIEIYKAFQGDTLPAISKDRKNTIGEELRAANSLIEKIKPVIESIHKSNLYPEGFKLTDILELTDTFKKYFDNDMPGFEGWDLHSNGWLAYQDDLMELSNSGERWSSYRRKGSDTFTDEAVDANICAARDEFVKSLGSTLKGLSDHYRRPKRLLLSVFKNPREINSDDKLVEKIDELIEIQEHRRKYKDSSVLATRLFGKDWKFEKTAWKDLASKIQHYYAFRARNKNYPKIDHLIHILEQWHLFKPFVSSQTVLQVCIKQLEQDLDTITKVLNLSEPLKSQDVDVWVNKISGWAKYWDKQDVYLELCEHMDNISDSPCENLAQFVKEPQNANSNAAAAFARAWTNCQMQAVTSTCPNLFSCTAKNRKQKGSQYKNLLDQFSNANFSAAYELVEKKPALLQSITLSQSYISGIGPFDVTLFLDADCMTIAEAMPGIINSKKTILFGNPCTPALEALPMDACNMNISSQSIFYKDNVLTATLRKGTTTSVIGFTTQYADPALFAFANSKIYDRQISQFPNSTTEKDKLQTLKVVQNKVSAIAESAVQHALKAPSKTLGIVAGSPMLCVEIEAEIQKLLEKNPAPSKFFTQGNLQNKFYIKTVERAVDLFRDVIFVCPELETFTDSSTESRSAANRKIAICSTLAKQKLTVFISNEDADTVASSKTGLFYEWIHALKARTANNDEAFAVNESTAQSVLDEQIQEVFKKESIPFKESFSQGGIPLGPVIVDANNDKRFLAVIESDCDCSMYNESIEDREYIRPNALSKFGWKVINMWLPLWNVANADEKENLVTTIAIEQSVAPPPEEEQPLDEMEQNNLPEIVPYTVEYPSLDGASKGISLLDVPSETLIEQLKFFVDYESPIHADLLLQRMTELYHANADAKTVLHLATVIKQALHQKQFIKTGQFFYSLTNKQVTARNRSKRPDSERKMAYVSPEERALLKHDDHSIKQMLGVL